MTTNGEITVEDDEGIVDKKTKEQILNLRGQIDDDERALYVERMSNPQYRFSVTEANQYWGISVRQYLRSIKRLWSETEDFEVRNVGVYWEELELGKETLVPPDQDGYQFSMVRFKDKYSDAELRRLIGLPRRAELPEVEEKTFYGLNSILSTNRIEHTWVVTTDTSGPRPKHETKVLDVAKPLPKHILENAIEAADDFLQQAGVGFEVGVPDYHGGEEPGI